MPKFSCKQVIVVRADLKMSKGKIVAQAGHAAVSASEEARKGRPNCWKAWMTEGQCKIAVKVESERELLELYKKAKKLKLPSTLISDRGLTELPPGTLTCLGIGPAPSQKIDKVTVKLTLF